MDSVLAPVAKLLVQPRTKAWKNTNAGIRITGVSAMNRAADDTDATARTD